MSKGLEHDIAVASEELEAVLDDARDQPARAGHLPQAYDDALSEMHERAWVDARWHIAWPTWPTGLRAKAVALVQKVIRAALTWYVGRLTASQNRYNVATLKTIELLSEEILLLRRQQVRDRDRIDALQQALADLQQRMTDAEGRR